MSDLATQLAQQTDTIRARIAPLTTVSVAGWVFQYHLLRDPSSDEIPLLHSGFRQLAFLLGLLVSTPEPAGGREMTKAEWEHTAGDLNALFSAYTRLFWPNASDGEELPDEWHRVREVAMPAFLHYFHSGVLASPEQVATRVRRYLAPFDRELQEVWGLTATEALRIADALVDKLQQGVDACTDATRAAQDLHRRLLATATSPADMVRRATTPDNEATVRRFADALERLGKVRRADLGAEFGAAGQAFWHLFSVGRGEGGPLTYPTEESVVELRPLVRLADDDAVCPAGNMPYLAILRAGETVLEGGPHRDRYFAARDATLEAEAADQVRRLLGPTARVYVNVCETPNRQFEHDVVATCGDLLLIVEAKASPSVEPFRDPEKAYTRLRRAFRSPKGIQSGFEQAARLRRRLDAGERVTLYDWSGSAAVELAPAALSHRHAVCVTRDDFGPLATDLALLLEKRADEPYPWALNIFDLEALADAWGYLGWGGADLQRYLGERTRLHGKAFSSDELDYAGHFVQHGSLGAVLDAPADLVVLDPRYSNYFDALYAHLYHGGPKPRAGVGRPTLHGLEEAARMLAPPTPAEAGAGPVGTRAAHGLPPLLPFLRRPPPAGAPHRPVVRGHVRAGRARSTNAAAGGNGRRQPR